jgi:hypothetical protein
MRFPQIAMNNEGHCMNTFNMHNIRYKWQSVVAYNYRLSPCEGDSSIRKWTQNLKSNENIDELHNSIEEWSIKFQGG